MLHAPVYPPTGKKQGTTGNHRGTEITESNALVLSVVSRASEFQSLRFGETAIIALGDNLSILSLFFLHRGLRTVSFIQSVRIHPDI